MNREQIFEVINKERDYQDLKYNPDEVLASGLTRRQRDQDVTSHIALLEEYALKARQAWVPKGGSEAALKQIAKIAAIAVRALERAGGAEEAVRYGLR